MKILSPVLAALLICFSFSSVAQAVPVTSGLVMWFDGQDINGDTIPDTLAGGTSVTAWNSKAGGAVATASAGGRIPVIGSFGGSQVVQFDGNDYMDITGGPATHQTAFFVYNDVSTLNWTTPLGTAYNGKGSYHGNNGDGAIFNNTHTDALSINGASYRNGGSEINELATPRPDSMSINAHVATAAMTRAITTLGADACITCDGGNRGINGQLAEVVVYDRALSTAELNQVGNFLASKWSLSWSPASTTYTSAASGNFSDPNTWTPAGGPPLSFDNVNITANSSHHIVHDAAAAGEIGNVNHAWSGNTTIGSRMTLQSDLHVTGDYLLGRYNTLDIGSSTLTVDGTLNFEQGSAFLRSPGSEVHVETFRSYYPHNTATRVNMVLDPNDTIGNLILQKGSSVTTSSVTNITKSVSLNRDGLNTNLYLGADLVLSGDLAIRESELHDNGFNVTVGGTFTNNIGSHSGYTVVRVGGIWNIERVNVGRGGNFPFRPGDTINDTVVTQRTFNAWPDFTVEQDGAFYDTETGLTLQNSASNALSLGFTNAGDKSELNVIFDATTNGSDFDWGFRWRGDHQTTLQNLFNNGQIPVTSPQPFSAADIFYNPGDDYTYIGYGQQLTDLVWDDGNGDWALNTNWNPDFVPIAASLATINNGGTANVTTPGQTVGTLQIDNGGANVHAGGELTASLQVNVGAGGNFDIAGILTAPTVNSAGNTTVSSSNSNIGVFNATAGTTNISSPANSIGTLNVNGATVNASGAALATNVNVNSGSLTASASTAVTNFNVQGGLAGTTGAGEFVVASGGEMKLGQTTLTAAGGSFAVRGNDLLNPTAGQHNTLKLSGGSVTITPPNAANNLTNVAHQWTFSGNMNDSIGSAHGVAENANVFVNGNGELQITGTGRMLTSPIGNSIGAKTLMVWTTLDNPSVSNRGSALTLENNIAGSTFDGIVYGERTAQQWMAGSNFFQRTPVSNGGAAETSTDEVMIAIVYNADNSITLYRDGVQYGNTYTQGSLVTYDGNSVVQIGRRHGTNGDTYRGLIDEARIYNVALSGSEISDIYNSFGIPGDINMPFWDVEATADTQLILDTDQTVVLGDLLYSELVTIDLASGPSSIDFGTLTITADPLEGTFSLLTYDSGVLVDFLMGEVIYPNLPNGWTFTTEYTDTAFNITLAQNLQIPEPASIALWGVLGLVLLAARSRKKRV